MATTTTTYNIDHLNKKIILTKKFAAKSSIYGTVAYDTLVGLRKDYPDYKLELRTVKNSAKIKRSHPSYDKMREYIRKNVDKNRLISAEKEFESVVAKAKSSENAYTSVLEWFNENYPENSANTKSRDNAQNKTEEGGESDE